MGNSGILASLLYVYCCCTFLGIGNRSFLWRIQTLKERRGRRAKIVALISLQFADFSLPEDFCFGASLPTNFFHHWNNGICHMKEKERNQQTNKKKHRKQVAIPLFYYSTHLQCKKKRIDNYTCWVDLSKLEIQILPLFLTMALFPSLTVQ